MSGNYFAPGVYVEEIPSGVRTITGVATSVTAFLGRARLGPANKAVAISSFGEFERLFGGLWAGSAMSYAVRDFFVNGGTAALIVRLVDTDAPKGVAIAGTEVSLVAASPGAWANDLRISIKKIDSALASSVGTRINETEPTKLFNLTVKRINGAGDTVAQEVFSNVSLWKGSRRRIDNLLKEESALVRWNGADLSAATSTPQVAEAADVPIVVATTPADETTLAATDIIPAQAKDKRLGLYALDNADIFNLLVIPTASGDDISGAIGETGTYCSERRAMLILDSSPIASDTIEPGTAVEQVITQAGTLLTSLGPNKKNAVLYFPRMLEQDPLQENRLAERAPSGAIAGIFARTDAQRGVWKAPAGLNATIGGATALRVSLTSAQNGELNRRGINCLLAKLPAGLVVWGARTLDGDDQLASEWKYVPVRRTALYIEESLYRGLQWVVFEPNDEPLWAQIRLNVGAFMFDLFRQGAFQGSAAKDAYFVKCDKETTTQNDINRGIVNIVVGFAPLKPAEFVVLKLQQMAGQIQT